MKRYRLLTVVSAMAMLAAIVVGAEPVPREASNAMRLIAELDADRIIEHRGGAVTLEVDGASAWRPGGSLTLTTDPPTWALPRIRTPSFYLLMGVQHPDAEVINRLAADARIIVERDDGSSGVVRRPFHGEPLPRELLFVVVLAVVLAVILLRARRGSVVWDVRMPHLIPSAIQTTLFAYWSLYWPGVGERVPSILLQIVLAYACDGIISVLRERTWRIGFGPLPMVLSANLFAWFAPPGAIVVVVAAVASRAFIRHGTRHVLNPSAAGLTLAGLLSLASPLFTYESVFHTLNLAPNMAEVLIVLTLIPQVRFRIVLVSIGAVIGLVLSGFVFRHYPVLGLPGTLITFALFATDPATIPRTPVGQLLFGAIVGSGMAVSSTLLTVAGYPDVFSKVFPVPIANTLVSRLDAFAATLSLERLSFLAPGWNAAHVAFWLCLVVPSVCITKPSQFLVAPHWTYATPLVTYRSTNALRCEENPTFCQPFTFVQEIAGWWLELSDYQ